MENQSTTERDRQRSTQESSFDQHPLAQEVQQGTTVPRSMPAVPFQLKTSDSQGGSSESTGVDSLLMDDSGGFTSAPVQAKLANDSPIQRKEAPIQRQTKDDEPTVPVQIYFSGTLNQEEFKQAAMRQLFGGPVDRIEWTLTRSKYTSPHTLHVAISLLKRSRGENNKKKGIPSDGNGVEGSEKRRKDFKDSPKGADKDALLKEINRRYREASGDKPGSQLSDGPQDAAKRELWKQIQDEVLFQSEYIKNLPEAVKRFIKLSTNGRIFTPRELEQLFRIVKAIEAMPPDIANEYLSRVTGETTDLDKFEQSLHRFREEMDKQRDLVEENNSVKNTLVGLEAIYRQYRVWKDMTKSSISLAGSRMPMGMGTAIGSSKSSNDLYKEIDEACKAHGFQNGITDFETFIKQFELGFEKQAHLTAIAYLDKYQGSLYREQQRYKDNALMTDLLAKIKGGADKATLQGAFSVFNDQELPGDKQVNMDRLKGAKSGTELGTMLSGYANMRAQDVREAKDEINGESRLVFRLNKLMPMFYLEQNIGPDSIYDMIIQDKIRRDALEKLAVGILIAIIAIALAVVSLGAAVPGIIAAGSVALGFGISAHAVYEEYKNYALEKNLAEAGLADDPSMVWLIIAVAGAMLDMGAAARAISKLGPAAKALQNGGDIAEFQKVVKAMQKAGELDSKAAAAAEKAAMAQRGFQKTKEAFDARLTSSGAKSFAEPQFYAELVEMAKFKSMQGSYSLIAFMDELKAMRKLRGLPDLNAEEIAKVRLAWQEGRAAARVAGETVEATDEMVKGVRSNLGPRITSKFDLKYTDAEIKSLITKGRANNLSTQEIEDLILVGSRKDKPLTAIQLMDQMDFSVYLKARGYPAKFRSLAEFREFTATLKSEIGAIGGPTNDIRIQGSSLRTATANDVDLVAMMPQSMFDDIVKRAYAGKLKEGGVPVDFSKMDHAGLVDLLNRIKTNSSNFNSIRSNFEYVFGNKMINSKQMKKEIREVFNAEGMLAKIQAKYPHLNIENISFQIPGGAFDLQPYLRLQ